MGNNISYSYFHFYSQFDSSGLIHMHNMESWTHVDIPQINASNSHTKSVALI